MLDVPSFLASIAPETGGRQRVHDMLRLLYDLCSLSVLLASCAVLLVCLLATHNSTVVLSTQALLVAYLFLVRYYGAPLLQVDRPPLPLFPFPAFSLSLSLPLFMRA